MRTQSADTHPDAERMMVTMIRNAPVSKRFRLIQSLTQSTLWSSVQAGQTTRHHASEREAAVWFISCAYGPTLAQRVRTRLEQQEHWHLQPVDLLAVMQPAFQILDAGNISHYLGGSIASSISGMQQMAQDSDIVVDLRGQALSNVVRQLRSQYVCDEDAIQQAVQPCNAFPFIHLDSLMKIDLIIPNGDAFDTSMRQSALPQLLDEHYPPVSVASAQEMILWKMARFHRETHLRKDGMSDDAEWNDILGMLKVQGSLLDRDVLEEWAERLKITETLRQALLDAGEEERFGSKEKPT